MSQTVKDSNRNTNIYPKMEPARLGEKIDDFGSHFVNQKGNSLKASGKPVV